MRLVVYAMVVFLTRCVQNSVLRSQDAKPSVSCTSSHMHARFGPAVQNNLQVKDQGSRIPVPETKEKCGVKSVQEEDGRLSFYSRYESCYSDIKGDSVVVALEVQVGIEGPWYQVNISCPLSQYEGPDPKLTPGTCRMQKSLRVSCGPQGVSRDACLKLGCCFCRSRPVCYYRIDACSLDGNFVFSVNASDFLLPVSLGSLRVKGQPQCTPATASTDMAVFKFGVTECGAKRVIFSKVVSYEVEVEALPRVQTVARVSPYRLRVQCLYAGSVRLRTSMLSKDPTKPPVVSAVAIPKLRMRIARDESFSLFVPEDELPLELPLRSPVHVEVSFAEPSLNSGLALRLRDCFAFPVSRHSLWTLLHDGCPNPLDRERSAVLLGSLGQSLPQVRRFDVKTFTFIDPKTGEISMEELYFFCWVEICTGQEDCEQQCPFLSYGSGRMRRESKSDQVSQLVFFGPVLLGQNGSRWEGIHGAATAVPGATVYQMLSVYALSVVCGAALLFLFSSVWTNVGKRRQSRHPNGVQGVAMEMEVAGSVAG
ncbi:zona pellucida sperm-binding protein 1-like isoform X1 [Conger conger]|uniref:zona pellucida sperm-binding protein 1-like isoform X1 n=1 Tax=Conger conger TaxID=82655 RepID=UPI002A5B01B8|nr:zona pellucida sperm-binding protein 1-like isoform X1 [Conger conger]